MDYRGKTCRSCRRLTSNKCDECGIESYCSKECQEADRVRHRDDCVVNILADGVNRLRTDDSPVFRETSPHVRRDGSPARRDAPPTRRSESSPDRRRSTSPARQDTRRGASPERRTGRSEDRIERRAPLEQSPGRAAPRANSQLSSDPVEDASRTRYVSRKTTPKGDTEMRRHAADAIRRVSPRRDFRDAQGNGLSPVGGNPPFSPGLADRMAFHPPLSCLAAGMAFHRPLSSGLADRMAFYPPFSSGLADRMAYHPPLSSGLADRLAYIPQSRGGEKEEPQNLLFSARDLSEN